MAAKNVPQKKEDYITNKVLAVFSICLAGVLVLMGLRRLIDFGSTYVIGMTTVLVLMGVSVLGIVIGLVMRMREKSKSVDTAYRILTGRNVLIVSAAALVILALVHHYGTPIFKVFYALLPALAVYYLIYHSYQPEFCVISVDCGAAAVLLLVLRRIQLNGGARSVSWLVVGVCAALALVQIALALQVKKANGKLTVGGKKRSFRFSGNAYTMLMLTPVVMTALLALGAALGAAVSLYAVFGAVGYLFVTAVYYTVKLM